MDVVDGSEKVELRNASKIQSQQSVRHGHVPGNGVNGPAEKVENSRVSHRFPQLVSYSSRVASPSTSWRKDHPVYAVEVLSRSVSSNITRIPVNELIPLYCPKWRI